MFRALRSGSVGGGSTGVRQTSLRGTRQQAPDARFSMRSQTVRSPLKLVEVQPGGLVIEATGLRVDEVVVGHSTSDRVIVGAVVVVAVVW